MPPRRDPVKPGAKKSKLPRFSNTPKGKGEDEDGDQTPNSGDDEELDVVQSTALEKILSRFDGVEAKIEERIKSVIATVDEGIRAQEFNSQQMDDKLQKQAAEIVSTKREVKALSGETDGLHARVTFQNFRLTDLEVKIEQLERENRRNLMLIEGVIEEEGRWGNGRTTCTSDVPELSSHRLGS